MRRCIPLLLALPFLLLVSSCDEGNPVAPSGSFLLINANPARISINGSSQITITGRRPDGNPLSDGTEVRLTTSLGSIFPNLVEIDNGTATAVLRADGRQGTATVTASVGTGGGGGGDDGGGGGSGSTTLDVQIGEDETTAPSLRVTVNPNNIPVGDDSRAIVTVVANNADGTPLAEGQTVILTTTLGDLRPDRPETDATGTATARLIAGNQAGTAEITASVGSSQPVMTSLVIRDAATDISLQANPQSINRADSTIQLTAFVTNGQGQGFQGAPVTFQSERGTLSQTGVVFTDSTGIATNTLMVTQEQLGQINSFTVTALTPQGDGDLISAQTTIVVN